MKANFILLSALLSITITGLRAQGRWDTTSTGTVLTTTNDSVGIGTNQPQSKFHLNNGDLLISENGYPNFKVTKDGLVRAREVRVNLDSIPDYVFEPGYQRLTLYQLEQYIKNNKHLPNIPRAGEYNSAGSIDIGKLQLRLLEKVEELTLYIIELQKENDILKEKMEQVQKELSKD